MSTLQQFREGFSEAFGTLLEGWMDELFGRGSWPAGIRSVAQGTCPPEAN